LAVYSGKFEKYCILLFRYTFIMGNKLCPRKVCNPTTKSDITTPSPQELINTYQLIVDHGTGETKLYKITRKSIPSPYARPVLHIPGQPPPPKIHISVPEIIEIDKWGALIDNLEDIEQAKNNIISTVSHYNLASKMFIGTTAWHRNADTPTKEKADRYLQEMKFTTQDTGINTYCSCISGEQEAIYEATAVCFASEIVGIPPPSIIVSSGGGSFQLSLKNPIKGWVSTSYNIGFREGIDILNKDGENHVKVSSLRNKTKLAISGMSNFITENLPQFDNSRQLRVVAISASYYAANAASISTGINAVTFDTCINKLCKTIPATESLAETYKIGEMSETEKDKFIKTIANSVIQHEIFSKLQDVFIDAYSDIKDISSNIRLHFCRDFKVNDIEFRCNWPMGKYIIDNNLLHQKSTRVI